jgi:hypothetical protein
MNKTDEKPAVQPAPPPQKPAVPATPPKEFGGPAGPEPTRYGDWERNGRVSDF